MPINRKIVDAAADKLEELLPEMRELINRIRHGCPAPYAEVYHLRREIGRVVANLGVGVPASHDQESCQRIHGHTPR